MYAQKEEAEPVLGNMGLALANRKGIGLLIGYEDVQPRLFSVKFSISKLQSDVKNLQDNNVKLINEMPCLQEASIRYRAIRSRFLIRLLSP